MVRPEVIRRKLSHLSGYLSELERHRDVTFEAYVGRAGPKREIERLIQLIVECAADLNVHVVTETEGKPPEDYRSSFFDASRCGLLPRTLADRLAPSAGLRNALVHDYGDIDDERVHASVGSAVDGFTEYARSVQAWLDQHHPDPT